jgi:hypothetical protein
MQIVADGYKFDFPDAIEAYKFDETDKLSPYYHGVTPLKAVDVMVELPNTYLFIEIKSYDDLSVFAEEHACDTCGAKVNHKNWLKNNLVRKYRDTFLYRYCEKKLDKPIIYVCLLNFDSALLSFFKKRLREEIPLGNSRKGRWKKTILEHVILTNMAAWNRNLVVYGTCEPVGGESWKSV